jgi:hypothetical protein
LNSTFGRIAHPTPFQTTRHGRVFLVEWDNRSKAHEICTQVQHAAKDFAKNFEAMARLRAATFPPRHMDEYTLSYEVLREVNDVREGFSVTRGTGNSAEYGNNLINAAEAALARLKAGGLVTRIQNAKHFSEEGKANMLGALERLKGMEPVLRECRANWQAEIQSREVWMADLTARLTKDNAQHDQMFI